jgi:hypothetical protein
MQRAIVLTVIIVQLIFFFSKVEADSSVEQYGIRWNFGEEKVAGRFANGDWWVVGPLTITSISPAPVCSITDGRNGTMVNPRFSNEQGYDSRAAGYNISLCRQPGASLAVNPGDSVVSTISLAERTGKTYLQTGAVLTVVDAPQTQDKLRPPYTRPARIAASSSDSLILSTGNIKWNLLPSLSPVEETPALADTAGKFQRPWIEHFFGWQLGNIQPRDNMPNYGRDNAAAVSEAALQLMLNYSTERKRELLLGFLQYGIDLYGVYLDGGQWRANGGIFLGRKWPILFAGILLDDDMKAINNLVDEKFKRFQEDGQTYYYNDANLVECADLDGAEVSCNAEGAYRVRGMLGKVDQLNGGSGDRVMWRIREPRHNIDSCEYEHLDISVWTPAIVRNPDGSITTINGHKRAENYRRCCTSSAWVGYALAARLMGAIELWGHNAFFDYVDRWMTQDDSKEVELLEAEFPEEHDESIAGTRPIIASERQGYGRPSPFVRNMWNAYRGNVSLLRPSAPTGLQVKN